MINNGDHLFINFEVSKIINLEVKIIVNNVNIEKL
jgi:hypothetical protein